jgi:ribosomal protein S18 acetylase RimI-like enzyme
MHNLNIRTARLEDAQTILDYLKHVGQESDNLTFGPEGLGASLDEERAHLEGLADNPNSCTLVAFVGEDLVSVGTLSSSKRERSKHYALLGISVLKAYWHQGIGRRMMQALIEFAQHAPDTRYLELEVRHDNRYAVRLYESVGFTKVARFEAKMVVNGVDVDTWVMVKKLDTKKAT